MESKEKKHIAPVQVKVKLHRHLQMDINKWKITLFGEERLVTNQVVEFSAFSFESAINGFKQYEVEEVQINWKNPL